MSEERKSFWERVWKRLFGDSRHSTRQEKVLAYIVCRLDAGGHLRDVVQEEYVRRLASAHEVEQILGNPEVVETARKRMHRDLGSEDLRSRGWAR